MAEEQQGGNVARVGLSLDSSAFRSGVQRTLADIESLLSGLRKLGSAGTSIGANLLGPGGKSAPLQLARDIQRNTLPALQGMERQILRVNTALSQQNRLQESSIAAFTAASKARIAAVQQETTAQIGLLKAQEAARRAEARARLEASRSEAALARDRAAQIAAERQYLADLRAAPRFNDTARAPSYSQRVRLRNEMEAPTQTSFMPHPSGSGQLGYKYVVVPLKDVVTSKDPGFPAILQPRDRDTKKSDEQIRNIINSPKWDRIFQATDNLERGMALLVDMEGRLMALQGNARTLGTRGFIERTMGPAGRGDATAQAEIRAFMNAQAAFIKAHGAQFEGGTKGAAAEFQRLREAGQAPYIARIVAQTIDQLGGINGLGRIALQANNATMTAEQEAIAVARLLGRTPNLGSGSPAGILANKDAARAFMHEVASIVGETRYRAVYAGDDMNSHQPAFNTLLQRTLAARAFGSDVQTERMLNAAFSGKSSALASKSFMEQLIKGVGDQLAIRARVEAGHMPAEMDPFYGRLGPALQVIKDIEGMYGATAIRGKTTPEMAMTRINAATAGGMAGQLGDIPGEDVKRLAQSILVAGDKGMPALIKALSTFASRVESFTTPSLFGAQGGTLPMDFDKMLEAAQQSVLAYTNGLSDALKQIKAGKPGAARVPAAQAEAILNDAVNGTLQRIAESYAASLGAAPVTPPPASRGGAGQPFGSKEEALLRARGEDLRTFGMNPRLIGTAPTIDYANAAAEEQLKFNQALMAGMTRYREYARGLASSARMLQAGTSPAEANLPAYYLSAYAQGMPVDKLIEQMRESMRNIGKLLRANYGLLGSRGILEQYAATTRRAAAAAMPAGGPAALGPYGSLPFEGKFDPATLAFNSPDKLKYTRVAGVGMTPMRVDRLFDAMRPLLEQYFVAEGQATDPMATLAPGVTKFNATALNNALRRGLNKRYFGGLIGTILRDSAPGGTLQGTVEAPKTYDARGAEDPKWAPMGGNSLSLLSINNLSKASAISAVDTLIHEISHTTMRAAYGSAAGVLGSGGKGVEFDPRFGALQARIAMQEQTAFPIAVQKIIGSLSQSGDIPTMMRAYASDAGGVFSHKAQPMYVKEYEKALGPDQAAKAREVAQFIVDAGKMIASAFGSGGTVEAAKAMNDTIAQFLAMTTALAGRSTYALEAAGTIFTGYTKFLSTDRNINPHKAGGQAIATLENAVARMMGTGRALPYANALRPDLPAEMRGFIAAGPTELLQLVADLSKVSGTVKNLQALEGPSADDLRAALGGLVRDFEKASEAAKKFATSSEAARAQVAPGGPQAQAPPSVSNILPPSITAAKTPPKLDIKNLPLIGPSAGYQHLGSPYSFGGYTEAAGAAQYPTDFAARMRARIGGYDPSAPSRGPLETIFGAGGGGNAGGGAGGGGGRGFGGGGGGSPFENFRSWWATNGTNLKEFLKFVAGSGYPRYSGPGQPAFEYTTKAGDTIPGYTTEQLRQQRNIRYANIANAAYQGTIGNIMPEYRSAYSSYQSGQFESKARSDQAKRAYVEQALNAQAAAGAQSRLNLIMRDGHIQFGQLAKAATAVGNGMLFSTTQTVKFAAALAFGRQVTMTIIQMFDHFRGGIIKFNADIEAASVGFTTLFKNSGMTMDQARAKTEETIQTLLKFANVTNFRFGDLETAALRMKAFGFEIDTAAAKAKGQMPILEALKNPFDPNAPLQFRGAIVNIGDAVAALGAEDDKLRRVTYALGQMNSAGRVYQNDMMQLANAGIAGYEILSKELLKELEADGKQASALYKKLLNPQTAVEEVRKLARTGKISGPAAVQAIMRGLEERYGGGMAAFAKTFRGAMTTIADTSQYLIATAFKPFFEMVRDQTYKLAQFLQTGEATKQAKAIGVTIGKLTEGIKGGMPGAIKVLGTFASAFTNVIDSFSNNLAKPGNTFVGFFDSFAKGLGIIGDILSNQVIGRLVATGVAMKVLTSAMAANPLLATLIGGTAVVGFLGNAAEQNLFGMRDQINSFTSSIQNALSSTSTSLVPTLTAGMSSALQVVGAMLLSFTQSILPILQNLVEIFSALSGNLTTIAPLLGGFFGLWVGKKLLIDGIASAMLKLNTAAQNVKGTMANWRMSAQFAAVFGARARYSDQAYTSQTFQEKIIDPNTGRQAVNDQNQKLFATQFAFGAGAPGQAITSPALFLATQERLRQAAENYGKATGMPTQFIPAPAGAERTGAVSVDQAKETLRWLSTPAGQKFAQTLPAQEAAQLKMDLEMVKQGARSFGQALKETFTTMSGFKSAVASTSRAIVSNLGQFGQGVMAVGIGLSALGSMLNNEFLKSLGGAMTNLGLFAMGLQALMSIFMMFGASSGLALGLTALTAVIAGLAVAAGEATKKFNELAGKTSIGRAATGAQAQAEAFKTQFGEGVFNTLKEQVGTTLTDAEVSKLMQEALVVAKEMYPDRPIGRIEQMEAYKYLRERYVSPQMQAAMAEYSARYTAKRQDLVYGPEPERRSAGYYAAKKKAQDVEALSLFGKGMDIDSIAKMIYGSVTDYSKKRITDAIAAAKGTEEGEKALKLLQGAVDVSGEIAQNAAEALQKASQAFLTPLQRLMSRANDVLRAVFEEEKKALETERSSALDNIMVMYDGEVMRLGTLKEQHAALVEQRKETEKLRALEKDREAAAEAAAAMFDAGTDPLQRAVAAREAARNLTSQQEQNRIDSMAGAISAGEASVSYRQTATYFDDKLKQLETDQQERQRRLDERIQDLQKQIEEGKISVAKAQAELESAFADAGIDLNVLRLQGSSVGEQFGAGFWQGLTANIDSAFKKLPAYVRAAAAKLNADAALKAAQETLAAAMEPKITYVPASRVKESLTSAINDLKLKQQQVQLLDLIAQMQPGYDKKKPGIAVLSTLIRAQIESFSKQRDTLTPGSQRDTQELTAISQTLAALLDQITTSIKTLGINGPVPNMPYPHAQGGSVQAGSSYLVGERGPEVLAVGKSGKMQVIPNHMLPTYLRSSAGALMAGKTGRMRGFADGTPVDPTDIPALTWIRGITNPYNRFIHQIRTVDQFGDANLPTLGMDLGEYNDRLKLMYVLHKAGLTRILGAKDLLGAMTKLAQDGKLPADLARRILGAPASHHLSGVSGGHLGPRFDFEDSFFATGRGPLSTSMATSYVGGLAADYSTLGGIPFGGSIEDVAARRNQTQSALTLITRPGAGKAKTTTTTLGDALSNRKLLPQSIFDRFGGPLSVLLPGGRHYSEFQIPGGLDISEIESILGLTSPGDASTAAARAAQLSELGFLDLGHMAVASDVADRQLSEWRNGHAASGWPGAAHIPQDDYRVTAALSQIRNLQRSGEVSGSIAATALALFKAGKFSSIEEAAHFAATFPLYADKQNLLLRANEAARQAGIVGIEDARSTVKSIPARNAGEPFIYPRQELPTPTKTRLASGGTGIGKFINALGLDFLPFIPRKQGGTGQRYSFADFDIVVAPGVQGPVDIDPLIRGARKSIASSPIGFFAGRKRPTIILEAAHQFMAEPGEVFDPNAVKEGRYSSKAGGLYGDLTSNTVHINEEMLRLENPDRVSKTVAHELGHAITYGKDATKSLLRNPLNILSFMGLNPFQAYGLGGGVSDAMSLSTAKMLEKAAGMPVFDDPLLSGPQATGVVDGKAVYDFPQVNPKAVEAGLFPTRYSKTNPREHVAELVSHIIEKGGDVTKVHPDPKVQNYLRNVADHYGLRGPGLKASMPTFMNKAKGLDAKFGSSSKAQGIASLMADVAQMWATGTFDLAHLGTSVFMNLLGMIPKLGGPFTALAGIATTILSGGDLTRLVVGQFGSLLGGILGQTFIPVPFLGGFIGNILGGMFGDWIYTTFMNKAAAANPASVYAGGKGIFNVGSQGLFGGGKALGGSVFPGRAYLVGEQGPEIMVPSSLGSIIPNHKMRGPGGMAVGGMGGTINASVVINNPQVSSNADIDRLAAKVSEAQTRALRAAGYVRPR